MELKGKVAVITGASSGIGEGTARELADAGMKLVLTSRRKQLLDKIAAQLDTETTTIAGDITDESLPQKLIDTAVDKFGSCDVVFNNAGVMIVGSAEDIDLEAVCRMVRINVEAVYRLAIVAMRHMVSKGGGYLINTSSILGTKVRQTTGAYAGTKYAVEALTEDLRMQAAGTGVRVCALEPGLVETHLQDHFPVHPKDMLNIKALVQPADIGRAIRFMLEQPDHVAIPRILVMPTDQGM
ncbi:MAG: short-chain dehydrogenase [Planctomycetes bacterium B3_Pla]|nr:MAG: short-chain dehydrogenase [Planctomycetes bacterium B3_Pla]